MTNAQKTPAKHHVILILRSPQAKEEKDPVRSNDVARFLSAAGGIEWQ